MEDKVSSSSNIPRFQLSGYRVGNITIQKDQSRGDQGPSRPGEPTCMSEHGEAPH